MIRAVFFDVDETLVDFDKAARDAHIELFGDSDGYLAWCELTPTYWRRYTSGELDFAGMRWARMAHYLQDAGRTDDPGEAEARRWDLVERSFQCYDDVAPTLQGLRAAGLLLGVITNNDSVHQRRKLAAVGLADAFDVVVISGEVGVAKPDPQIFRHACARAAVPVDEALHVGDLLDVDALAAASAGLTGVWLDRHARAAGNEPVQVVSTLTGVLELVATTVQGVPGIR